MSWLNAGSGALAQITVLIMNDELASWLNERTIPAYSSIAA